MAGDYCDERELEELRAKLTWNGPASESARFLSVFMDQNNKCNLRCRMCGFSDPRVDGLAGTTCRDGHSRGSPMSCFRVRPMSASRS